MEIGIHMDGNGQWVELEFESLSRMVEQLRPSPFSRVAPHFGPPFEDTP